MKRLSLIVFILCVSLVYAKAEERSLFNVSQTFLSTLKASRYEHKAVIDEENGVYALDCSSFIGLLLQKSSLQAYKALPIDAPHKRPRAKNFYAFFNALSEHEAKKGWIAIKHMNTLRKGDIIAWAYDPALGKKDTGHVVMVHEVPVKEKDGRYKVMVLDSSKGIHANDTRVEKSEGGIGLGVMWFSVDSEETPIGLYWSDRSKFMSTHKISMARVQI